MDWDKVTNELNKKLNPAVVKAPPQGKYGQYIEGWHSIAEANRIFGFNGWSYSLDLLHSDIREGKDKNENLQFQATYTFYCTVEVDGTRRRDVGSGTGFSRNVGDAVEGAAKEAATDALKRALKSFGNQFGLALYDKAKSNVGLTASEPEIDDAITKLKGQSTMDGLIGVWKALPRHIKEVDLVIAAKDQAKIDIKQIEGESA